MKNIFKNIIIRLKLYKILSGFMILSFLLSCHNINKHIYKTGSAFKSGYICISEDKRHFIYEKSKKHFTVRGFNYDHDFDGRLLEDYWIDEWKTVEQDFYEMKELGANVIRIHLQLGKFIKNPDEADKKNINQLKSLLKLAEKTGLYLDITGLGCYHKKDVPLWYDAMTESERWEIQAMFWEEISKACRKSPAVFCYDLMNEPILPSQEKKENEWLAGEFGGKYFVQRISLDLQNRTQEEVTNQWVEKLVGAIRKHDNKHLITIGEIPWAVVFPGAKSIFHSKETGHLLDFISLHFYPEKNKVDKALKALENYNIGKPILIEEIFPLNCSIEELNVFIAESQKIAHGYIGFYWGKTIEEYSKNTDMGSAIVSAWLKYFKNKTQGTIGQNTDR